MDSMRSLWLGGIVAGLLTAAGCQRTLSQVEEAITVDLDGTTYRLSGPHSHDNLVVFLFHADAQDERDFITLDQGLKEGVVTVTEQDREQVQQLQIENRSDSPLFLQEGDRLQGGKQDRTIIASMVIPPASGKMPVPTFCIEQSRWFAGIQGRSFGFTPNPGFAPKEVRAAAKITNNQSAVWDNVAGQKARAHAYNLSENSNSSLNETLDDPRVKKISDEFAEALSGILDDHPDAVGAAIAVNGNIEEINVYPNHKLLSKLLPRLIQSYALEATLEKDKAKDAKDVAAADVVQFIADGKEKANRVQELNGDNSLDVASLENNKARCITRYKGMPVHRQVIVHAEGPSQVIGDNLREFSSAPRIHPHPRPTDRGPSAPPQNDGNQPPPPPRP
jgi:hypothetical protein